MADRKPAFIVVEGPDGLGKTTLVKKLAEWYRERHAPVMTTAAPSTGPVGSVLRQYLSGRLNAVPQSGPGDGTGRPGWTGKMPDPRTLALLFTADRSDNVQYAIRPALARGETVICDRYDLSTLVYQTAAFTAYDEEYLQWLRTLQQGALLPDVVLVLRGSVGLAEYRLRVRGAQREIFETTETQRRVVELYADAEQLTPYNRIRYVDANGSTEKVLLNALETLAQVDGIVLPPKY